MGLGGHGLETIAADTAAGEVARASKHALPPGTPCPNCATPLQGPWCHECGQKGEEFHRSIWHLVAEAFEGLTHFDGRFWNTLPRLILKPARLTRDYLEGHRVSQIPPFRLFLVVLLVFFFAWGLANDLNHVHYRIATPDDPEAAAALRQAHLNVGRFDLHLFGAAGDAWAKARITHAIDDPQAFFAAMAHWSHDFAILMLPIAALLLGGLFAFRRGIYVFDHLIFAMHSLSFQGLLLSASMLLGSASGAGGLLLLASPVHLFVHMRGTYRTGVAGTLLRMALLFAGSTIAFGLLMAALVVVSLAAAH